MNFPHYWWEPFTSGVKARRGILRVCKAQGRRFIIVAEVSNVDGMAEARAEIMVRALNAQKEI